MGSDDIFDILLLLFIIAILTPIMLQNTLPMFKGEIGGFGTLIEKSVQETDNQTSEDDLTTITKDQLSLMVVVTNKLSPEPLTIQFAVDVNNDGVVTDSADPANDELSDEITFDEVINEKVKILNTIDQYVPDNLDLKLCTLVGNAGIKKWMVCRK